MFRKLKAFEIVGKLIIVAIVVYISYLIFSLYFDIPGLEPQVDQLEEEVSLIKSK